MTASLERENAIKTALEQKFPGRVSDIRIERPRRMFAKIAGADAPSVIAFLKDELGFDHLSAITGLDEGENYAAIYHIVSGGILINLRVVVPAEKPVLQTVTGVFPVSEDFERELVDVLGFSIEGLKPGRRYPLPDDWPAGQYPLRKSWKGLAPAGGEGK